MTTLSPTAEAVFAKCFATRGPSKGHLKAKCPPSHTLEAAAWQAAIIVCNPYKASVAALLFMGPHQREIFNEVLAYMEAQPMWKQRKLDRDRATLSKLGSLVMSDIELEYNDGLIWLTRDGKHIATFRTWEEAEAESDRLRVRIVCPNPAVPVYAAYIDGRRIGSWSSRTDALAGARHALSLERKP